jgi:two-component system KDP operon response regulator KdpE
MPKRVHTLLVTPDEEWRAKLYTQLTQNGFEQVGQAVDGITALSLCAKMPPELVVIEAQLPDADGLALFQMIRNSYPPVKLVLLTDDASLQMTALQAGAAGCISRDIPLSEWPALLSYVSSGGTVFSQTIIDEVLAQGSLNKSEAQLVSVGPLTVDLKYRRVTLSGRGVYLTPREFAALACLSRNVGRVVTFDQLLNEAWGYETEVGQEAQVRLCIARLRRKLGDDSQTPDFIIGERGVGYRLRSQGEWRQNTADNLLNSLT